MRSLWLGGLVSGSTTFDALCPPAPGWIKRVAKQLCGGTTWMDVSSFRLFVTPIATLFGAMVFYIRRESDTRRVVVAAVEPETLEEIPEDLVTSV